MLFNPPLLQAFGAPGFLFGWPALMLYIFGVWLAVIALLALAVERQPGTNGSLTKETADVRIPRRRRILRLPVPAVRHRVGSRPLADRGRSVIATPYVYALSLGVFCTTWTFYGSVTGIAWARLSARAYLGPTLVMALGYVVIANRESPVCSAAHRSPTSPRRATARANCWAAGRRHRRIRRTPYRRFN